MEKIFEARPDLKKYDNPLNWIGFLPFEKDRILRLLDRGEYLREKNRHEGAKFLFQAKTLLYKYEREKDVKNMIVELRRVEKKYLEEIQETKQKNSQNPDYPICPD